MLTRWMYKLEQNQRMLIDDVLIFQLISTKVLSTNKFIFIFNFTTMVFCLNISNSFSYFLVINRSMVKHFNLGHHCQQLPTLGATLALGHIQ
jgi:hypothetical protein